MSQFFKHIPDIYYSLPINGRDLVFSLKDISLNVRVQDYIRETLSEFDHYQVIEGDTWDSISKKLYGVRHYHWLLMLLNLTWDGNASLPVTGDVMAKAYNASVARPRDAERHPNGIDKWMSEEPVYKAGVRGYQVAAAFTGGEEVYALDEGFWDNALLGPAGYKENAPWAQLPSSNYLFDGDGIITMPMDVYDSAEFVRRRPWLLNDETKAALEEVLDWKIGQSEVPKTLDHPGFDLGVLTPRAQMEYLEYARSFSLMTARDAIMEDNNQLMTIKVLNKNAITVVQNEILSIFRGMS